MVQPAAVSFGGGSGSSDGQGLISAKVRLIAPQYEQFQLGIGAFTGTDDMNTTWYAIVSTDLLKPPAGLSKDSIAVRAHLGYGTDAFDDSIIGGAELFFNPHISAAVEYDGNDVNAALRYADRSNWSAQVGIYGNDSDVFGSVSYNWGF